ncbi:MAG: hypothetical protein OQK05_01305 [Pseudopelagicola sp.]|nr:hypothetical protein [Pseudopelagicola sp.]
MFKFVHQTCLSAGLFAGCLTVLLAAPALAQTYDCNIRQRSWAGLISESYRFDVDAERDRVEVLDPIIRFARTKPVKGALEAVSPTEFRVTWGVEDVPIAAEGGPTDATFEAVLMEGETLEVQVRATWSDQSDAGSGKGRCVRAE